MGRSTAPLTYDPMGDGLTFTTPPLRAELELTGPSVLKLCVSSATTDADLFVVLRVFDPAGKEVLFRAVFVREEEHLTALIAEAANFTPPAVAEAAGG